MYIFYGMYVLENTAWQIWITNSNSELTWGVHCEYFAEKKYHVIKALHGSYLFIGYKIGCKGQQPFQICHFKFVPFHLL